MRERAHILFGLPRFARSVSAAFRAAPVSCCAVTLYLLLRSSTIFGATPLSASDHHPAFPGWYDAILFASVFLGIASGTLRIPRGLVFFTAFVLFASTLAYISGSESAIDRCWVDGLVHGLRLLSGIAIGIHIGQRASTEDAAAYALFALLVIGSSALVLTATMLDNDVRGFAPAMTIASTGHAMATASLLFLNRKQFALFAFTFAVMVLTLSRTSLVLFTLIAVWSLVLRARTMSRRIQFAGLLACVAIAAAVGIYNSASYGATVEALGDVENIRTFSQRTALWAHGLELLSDGRIPIVGIGPFRTPSLLTTLWAVNAQQEVSEFPHFHSIVFELGFGLGVFGLLLILVAVARLVRAARLREDVSFIVYSMFLGSQLVDYTLYRPKELLLWGLLIGLAEACLSRRHADTALLKSFLARNEFSSRTPRRPGAEG